MQRKSLRSKLCVLSAFRVKHVNFLNKKSVRYWKRNAPVNKNPNTNYLLLYMFKIKFPQDTKESQTSKVVVE